MVYTLKLIENEKNTIEPPEKLRKKYTNFIR